MEEEFSAPPPPPPDDITDNDKLLAAISYPIPIVAIIILIAEDMKARPFQRYHAVQALAANIALYIIITILGFVLGLLSFFIGGLCGFLATFLWFIVLYWAYEAYQGKYFEIRYLTEFLRKQNWL